MTSHLSGKSTEIKIKPRTNDSSPLKITTPTTSSSIHFNSSLPTTTTTTTTHYPSIVRPYDMSTVFISKTLFTIPTSDIGVSSSRYHHSSPALMTFTLDGKHIFVVYRSETSQRDGVSIVYVVRLGSSNPPISVCSRLPIADISGCVPNYTVQIELNNKVNTKEKQGEGNKIKRAQSVQELEKEINNKNNFQSVKSRNSFPQSQSVLKLSSSLPLNITSKLKDKNDVKTTNNKENFYSFLVADAAMHAIWVLEVDTESLSAQVVNSSNYLWNENDNNNNLKTINNKKEYMLKPKSILGGIEGFIDGPFHMARFSSPSALCWRMDDNCNNQNQTQINNPNCDVLFVSDTGNHAIRYVNFRTKMVRTIVGIDKIPGYRDGAYRCSQLQEAASLFWCSAGLLFTDTPNGAIRLITGLSKVKESKENNNNNNNRRALRVWTIAGGLYNNSGPYIDAGEASQASIGAPRALNILLDGSGVLFSDNSHHSLRVLTSRGIQTFLAPFDYPNSISFPAGLVSCTHCLLCKICVSDKEKHFGYIVSSGARKTVSLLLPCSEEERKEIGNLDFGASNINLITFSQMEYVKLQSGVIGKKYIRRNGKKSEYESQISPSLPLSSTQYQQQKEKQQFLSVSHITHNHKKKKLRDASFTTKVLVSPIFYHNSPKVSILVEKETEISSFLKAKETAAIRRLFEIYTHYANKNNNSQYMLLQKYSYTVDKSLHNTDYLYTLSLLSFWRFLAHAGYFVNCSSILSSSSVNSKMLIGAISGFTTGENGDCIRCNIQDWRAIIELLHELSIKQYGYHMKSTMGFSFFRRIILLLYRWQKQKEEQQKKKQDKENQNKGEERKVGGVNDDLCLLLNTSLEGIELNEIIAAYEDTIHRVECANMHLSQGIKQSKKKIKPTEKETGIKILEETKATTTSLSLLSPVIASSEKKKNQDENDKDNKEQNQEEKERLLAADEVLRLLVRNEKPLRQLFFAYSKKTPINCQQKLSSKVKKEKIMELWYHLRSVLLTGENREHTSVEWISAIPYTRFHTLFHTMDVFPTLISESMLQRAFVDALVTPLFHRLRREMNNVKEDNEEVNKGKNKIQEQEEREEDKDSCFTMLHEVEKQFARGGTALTFLSFVEAFTRVALTTFSLCGNHDREMYPTAVSKLEALMRWINRAFELGRTRKEEGGGGGGGGGGGKTRNRNSDSVGVYDGVLRNNFSEPPLHLFAYPARQTTLFPSDFMLFDISN